MSSTALAISVPFLFPSVYSSHDEPELDSDALSGVAAWSADRFPFPLFADIAGPLNRDLCDDPALMG
jgi:hypothetical protein